MNGAVHAASPQQRTVGGIDDGIHLQLGNIRLLHFQGHIPTSCYDVRIIVSHSLSKDNQRKKRPENFPRKLSGLLFLYRYVIKRGA